MNPSSTAFFITFVLIRIWPVVASASHLPFLIAVFGGLAAVNALAYALAADSVPTVIARPSTLALSTHAVGRRRARDIGRVDSHPAPEHAMKTIQDYIRTIPDFPHKGIMFRDVTTLFADPRGFRMAIDQMLHPFAGVAIDKVVGLEARGFIMGGAIAHQLSIGFVPVRKKGKLPGKTLSQDYKLEYGEATLEVHVDAIEPGERVLLVDDLLATGGTAEAGIKLLEKLGAEIVATSFIIDLPELGGRRKLEALGIDVQTLCAFGGK